jgi:hypothetical protein
MGNGLSRFYGLGKVIGHPYEYFILTISYTIKEKYIMLMIDRVWKALELFFIETYYEIFQHILIQDYFKTFIVINENDLPSHQYSKSTH